MSDNRQRIWPARRRMLAALGSSLLMPTAVQAQPTARRALLRPPRLRAGDTIGLVNPSGAVFERQPYELAAETLQALGFRVREAPNLRARYGHMAGTPAQRAADLHALVADDSVAAILAMTGGSGANRVLPLLDMELIARHPKVLAGFSDVTALLNGVHARTGLVTFHAPVGVSEWNEFSVRSFRRVVVEAEAATLANQPERGEHLVARDGRVRTLSSGRAQGPLLGGNLAVLASLAGSRYMPDFGGAILFLEDTNEFIYRVDRMLSTLMLAGVFDRLAGVVLGAFTNCQPGEGYGTLTLDEVFDDYFGRLGVPVYAGAQFGHIRRKLTLPVGLPVEMDADAGTIRLLQPAVS
ncbi:MAG: LD-carboxypeptidase [Aquabacterium sp.]|nr:LD-carboxypeptidase [Aquabacterium sp.]